MTYKKAWIELKTRYLLAWLKTFLHDKIQNPNFCKKKKFQMASVWITPSDDDDKQYSGCPLESSNVNSKDVCQKKCDEKKNCFVAQYKSGSCDLKKFSLNDDCFTDSDDSGSQYYFRFNKMSRVDIKHLLTQVDRDQLLRSGATPDQLAYLDDDGNESGSFNGSDDQSVYSTYNAVVEDQTPVDNVFRYSSSSSFDEVSPDPKYDVATYEDISTLPNPWTVKAPALDCGFLPTKGGEWGGSYARGTEKEGGGGNFFYPGSLPEILGPSNQN